MTNDRIAPVGVFVRGVGIIGPDRIERMTDDHRQRLKKMTVKELGELSQQLREQAQQINENLAALTEEIRARQEERQEEADRRGG